MWSRNLWPLLGVIGTPIVLLGFLAYRLCRYGEILRPWEQKGDLFDRKYEPPIELNIDDRVPAEPPVGNNSGS